MYVFKYSKLSNYFFALEIIILIDRSYQEYFEMFMVLGECKKNYRQAANMLNVILIIKENRMWHLIGTFYYL